MEENLDYRMFTPGSVRPSSCEVTLLVTRIVYAKTALPMRKKIVRRKRLSIFDFMKLTIF